MKKISIILGLAMVLYFTACIVQAPPSKSPQSTPTSTAKEPTLVMGEVAEIMDMPEMADFYAHFSVEYLANIVPPLESLGNPGRDSNNPDEHFKWADGNKPAIVKNELKDKIRIMANILEGIDKKTLNRWYARICSDLANLPVDFGSPLANSKDFDVHEIEAAKMKKSTMVSRIYFRIDKIFSFF